MASRKKATPKTAPKVETPDEVFEDDFGELDDETPAVDLEAIKAEAKAEALAEFKAAQKIADAKTAAKEAEPVIPGDEGSSTPAVDSGDSEVSFKFPKGTDPKLINEIMGQVGRMTQNQIEAAKGVEEGRLKYIEQCKKRYVCIVQSLRPGWDHFELIISNPTNDKPVTVRGRCGVILEEGITKYVIDQLNNTHDFRMEKGRSMTIQQILDVDQAFVNDKKAVKQYHYRVDILREKEEPKAVGTKIGEFATTR